MAVNSATRASTRMIPGSSAGSLFGSCSLISIVMVHPRYPDPRPTVITMRTG